MKNRLYEIFSDPLREMNNLSAKEREAARLASRALTNVEMAEVMKTTTTAIASFLRTVYLKTGMSKNELVKSFIEQIEKAIK